MKNYAIHGMKNNYLVVSNLSNSSSRQDTNLYGIDLTSGEVKCLVQVPSKNEQVTDCSDDLSKIYVTIFSGSTLVKGIYNVE